MTNKDLRYLIQRIKENKYLTRDETNYIIKALEQEPCEDAISRADAIKKVSEILKNVFVEYEDIAPKAIGELPPVTPQPKTEVLDKIRAEIEEHAARLKDSLYGDGLRHALEIIDKYRKEVRNE